MNGFAFYAAMPSDRGSKSASKRYPFQPWTRATLKAMAARGDKADVVAVYSDRALSFVSRGEVMREAVAGIFEQLDSPCFSTAVSAEWLRTRTVRIDESTARRLHPALFEYLDSAHWPCRA